MLRSIPIVPTIMTRTPSTTNSSIELDITIFIDKLFSILFLQVVSVSVTPSVDGRYRNERLS